MLFVLIYYYFYVFSPLLWIVGKWLAILVLALSVLSEHSYTLGEEKVLIIPIGIFCGIVFIGIMREIALKLSPSIEVFSCLFPFQGVLE